MSGRNSDEKIGTPMLPEYITTLRFSQVRGFIHGDEDFIMATYKAGLQHELLKRTIAANSSTPKNPAPKEGKRGRKTKETKTQGKQEKKEEGEKGGKRK